MRNFFTAIAIVATVLLCGSTAVAQHRTVRVENGREISVVPRRALELQIEELEARIESLEKKGQEREWFIKNVPPGTKQVPSAKVVARGEFISLRARKPEYELWDKLPSGSYPYASVGEFQFPDGSSVWAVCLLRVKDCQPGTSGAFVFSPPGLGLNDGHAEMVLILAFTPDEENNPAEVPQYEAIDYGEWRGLDRPYWRLPTVREYYYSQGVTVTPRDDAHALRSSPEEVWVANVFGVDLLLVKE